jgi:hypothetical protein
MAIALSKAIAILGKNYQISLKLSLNLKKSNDLPLYLDKLSEIYLKFTSKFAMELEFNCIFNSRVDQSAKINF